MESETDAHLQTLVRAAFWMLAAEFFGKHGLQGGEVHGFVKIAPGTKAFAMLLVFCARFASNHENRNARGIAQAVEALAKFETGEAWHHQVEQNCVWFVLQREGERLLWIAGLDYLVGV